MTTPDPRHRDFRGAPFGAPPDYSQDLPPGCAPVPEKKNMPLGTQILIGCLIVGGIMIAAGLLLLGACMVAAQGVYSP